MEATLERSAYFDFEERRVTRAGIRRWAELLIPFLSLQAIAQLVTVLAGFVVVRGLPIGEFAIYALVTALQAALAVLSDTGITTLLIARAGNFYGKPDRLAELVASARHGRRRLEFIVLVITGPLLVLWLRGKGLSAYEFVGIGAILAVGLHLQVSASLYIAVPLILLDTRRVQLALLAGGATRVAGLAVVVLLRPTYLLALAVNLVALGVQAVLSRRFAAAEISLGAKKNDDDLRSIERMVRTQLLNSVYYAFSSQLTIWIIGVLGTRRSIADVGALGRLGSLIALAQAAVATLVSPRMARLTEVKSFRRRYLQVTSLAFGAAIGMVALSTAFPGILLWLLGPKYTNLRAELPLAIGSSATYFLATTIFVLNSSKAWIERAWVAIPLIIGVQLLGALILDLSTVRGAIIFGWLSAVPSLAVNGIIGAARLARWSREGPGRSVAA